MSGDRHLGSSELVSDEMASILRHDLVSPINLIVGYTDLLLNEASDRSMTDPVGLLRSIRSFGFVLLNLIDRTLLNNTPSRSVADVQELAESLVGPASLLIDACESLESSTLSIENWDEFATDLHKIRAAGARLIEMSEGLEAGQLPERVTAPNLLVD